MTLSEWPLALTICLILSVAWAALLFGACQLAERVLPLAGDRHVLWWVGLLAVAAPPVALAMAPLAGAGTGGAGSSPFLGEVLGSAAPSAGGATVETAGFLPVMLGALGAVAPLLIALYGLGVLWHLLAHLQSQRRLKRLLGACRPLEDAEVRASVMAWAGRLGLETVPPVLVTSESCSPFSADWRCPVLVLPDDLLRRCPARQVTLICAHELAHVARRDLIFMRLQNALHAVLWFNPFAATIATRLHQTREAACDDHVLSVSRHSRRDYAQAFLAALRHSAGRSAHGIPFIHPRRKDHEMRLAHIMNSQPARPRKLRLAIAAAMLASATLPLAGGQAALAEALARKAPEFSGAVIAASMARMTSPYGPRVFKGEKKFHNGVDLGAPRGTPVRSPGNGRVLIVSGEHPGYGKRVEIDYGDGWRMIFGQLNSYDVSEGDAVQAGQQIGTVGRSGAYATGPHLHLEVMKDGKYVDPAAVLSLPALRTRKGTADGN